MYLEAKWDKKFIGPEIAIEPCQCPLNEIRKVYEQYKHMDRVLCDRGMAAANMPYTIACDLWQAIKAACESEEKENHD